MNGWPETHAVSPHLSARHVQTMADQKTAVGPIQRVNAMLQVGN